VSAVNKLTVVGDPERVTQTRVVALFRDELHYRYLGDLQASDTNSNIDEDALHSWLKKQGRSNAQIASAIYKLKSEANNPGRTLYANNKAVYELMRYGLDVKTEAGKPTEKVFLVDWNAPEQNDFAIAEEVTLKGVKTRRPDIVIYVNGIAIGVLELKNSRVSIGEGVRQSLSNQLPEYHEWFFTTVQFVFAGNDSEGLTYGTVGTPAKMFLTWKEDEADNARFKIDKYLLKMCNKARIIELMHDFVLFDAGVKKLPRVHQYFGIKVAQDYARSHKSGIIWHTQGSGKSIVMVLLAKWILENNPAARIAIITDRDELDKQIERVFTDAGVTIRRTNSGRELMRFLSSPTPRLMCSLIHKFGKRDVDDFEAYIKEISEAESTTVGDVYVFVDEAHRTQSGKLHRVMKAMLPKATFIGFTGTPLLKRDKQTSLEVFGGYIHTYKFREAVDDKVVLDLRYEARDIDQSLESPEKVDGWFAVKTRGLNDWKKDELKKHWATMQNVLSSSERMNKIVREIAGDFGVKPRLIDGTGNAMLIASSIYEAARYYEKFQLSSTSLRNACALITSYNPQNVNVTLEEVGDNTVTAKQYVDKLYEDILKTVVAKPGKTKTETYEDNARTQFVDLPAKMKLLIVVDKLLTGFDAPSCTYLYIDKSMQDHGLFQAITRTNRLDGETKEFGYIVDFRKLFQKVDKAISVYTSELDATAPGATPEILLKDRLEEGKERLDNAIESVARICEPVLPPRTALEYMHHFCGNAELQSDLDATQPQRMALYKAVATFIRASAEMAGEMTISGYSPSDIVRIDKLKTHYLSIRQIIKNASGETLDLKPFEADMRHLIDTYIAASAPVVFNPFDDMTLLEVIAAHDIHKAIEEKLGSVMDSYGAVAETIENNVRKKIITEQLLDPAYYASMSALLIEVIAARKAKALSYEEYLKRIADIVKKVEKGYADETPATLDTSSKRALWNNLDRDESLALRIDSAVRQVRPDDWRGVQARENIIKRALYEILNDEMVVERVFLIICSQEEY